LLNVKTRPALRGFPYVHVSRSADSKDPVAPIQLRSLQMNTPLLPEDKLAILQASDLRRKWHSLDDQRVCVLCDRTITGRQIEFRREAGGSFSVHCPTEGCPSVPSDWFYQGNACSGSKSASGRMTEANIWNG
jgi:hypothetical protein